MPYHNSSSDLRLILTIVGSLLAAATLRCQTIDVSCVIQDRQAVKDLFGCKTAKSVSMWVCAVSNNGAEGVQVYESALLPHFKQFGVIDSVTLSTRINSTLPRSMWVILGNGAEDGTKLAAAILAAKAIAAPASLLMAATLAVQAGPQLMTRIRGIATPVGANLAALEFSKPAQIPAGGSSVVRMFTGLQPVTAQVPDFSISIPKLPLVRTAQ